jgi:glycosyltransferase involved in cell wall biosynthesis|tara:strand:- start:1341 stop:2180 length:840 start_codon:yes stop_codon:yes gene_type:complete
MKSTIMIPAFNAEKFLPQTLESALNQKIETAERPEILIVNDGSTDRTREIIESYKSMSSNIKVIHQENQGSGVARNVLLKNAIGEILLGLDGDDILHPEALETVSRYFEDHQDIGFVFTDQNEIDKSGNLLRTRRRKEVNEYFKKLIYHCHFPGHLRSFRKSRLEGIKFDPSLRTAQDWDFLLKVFSQMKIAHIPKVLYDYRVHNESISLTRGENVKENSVTLLQHHLQKQGIYNGKQVKIIPTSAGKRMTYFEHSVNDELTMDPKARKILMKYLRCKD